MAFSQGCFFKRIQSEPSQPLAGSQARSRDLSSCVPQASQLHPKRHFPDFPVSPEMLTGAPASSALWHDLDAFPPTFNEIRELGMSFTRSVTTLLWKPKQTSRHLLSIPRESFSTGPKPSFWGNINSGKRSFQGCSGNKVEASMGWI